MRAATKLDAIDVELFEEGEDVSRRPAQAVEPPDQHVPASPAETSPSGLSIPSLHIVHP